jgi:tetratricopeptide (TPR) repeat protein
MSISLDEKNKLLLPRWLSFETAAKLGEISSDTRIKVQSDHHFAGKKRDWKKYRELIYAADLVGTAIVIDDFDDVDVREAAEFILNNSIRASQIALDIARTYVGTCLNTTSLLDTSSLNRISRTNAKISVSRGMLKDYPRNPILWADLAYYYAVVGQPQKSEKCMDVAISLSPDNRFILRSATRCYLHIYKGEKAHFYLKKSNATAKDPWLLATEISLAEAINKKSTLIKQGRLILGSKSFSNKTCSELAGALGTLEHRSGSLRASRKLFHQALLDPTENTIAQTEWLNKSLGLNFDFCPDDIPGVYEACARVLYRKKGYSDSLEYARQWMDFQPFSSRAANFGSYIASVCLRDHEAAIQLIENAKLSAPHDSTLDNNHAFALASLGRLNEAIDIIQRIKVYNLDKTKKSIINATIGMIMYKTGDPIKGSDLYRQSVKYFEDGNRKDLACIATLFWGLEEIAVNREKGTKILQGAFSLAKEANMDEIKEAASSMLSTPHDHAGMSTSPEIEGTISIPYQSILPPS